MYFPAPMAGPIASGGINLPIGHPPIVGTAIHLGAAGSRARAGGAVGGVLSNIIGLGDTGSWGAGIGFGIGAIAALSGAWLIPPIPIPYLTSGLKVVALGVGGLLAYSAAVQFLQISKKSDLDDETKRIITNLSEGPQATTVIEGEQVMARNIGSMLRTYVAIPVQNSSFSVFKGVPVVATISRADAVKDDITFFIRASIVRSATWHSAWDVSPLRMNSSPQKVTLAPYGTDTLSFKVPSPGVLERGNYFTMDIQVSQAPDFESLEVWTIAHVAPLQAEYL
jgi:hypothetical protein